MGLELLATSAHVFILFLSFPNVKQSKTFIWANSNAIVSFFRCSAFNNSDIIFLTEMVNRVISLIVSNARVMDSITSHFENAKLN